MKNFFQGHKVGCIITVAIVVASLLIGSGYWGYKTFVNSGTQIDSEKENTEQNVSKKEDNSKKTAKNDTKKEKKEDVEEKEKAENDEQTQNQKEEDSQQEEQPVQEAQPTQPTPAPEPAQTTYMDRAMAEAIWGYMNAERAAAGLNPIAWDEGIYVFACNRAQAIVSDFSHNGCAPYAENILMNSYPGLSAYDLHMQWYNSPGHHDNYMTPHYTVGACAVFYYNGAYYAVENFSY